MTAENDGLGEIESIQRSQPRWRVIGLQVAKWVLVALIILVVLRVLRQVDWSQVADALGHLYGWQVVVVVLLVIFRQMVTAASLVFLVAHLSLWHAQLTGFAGTLIQTFMPPPSDMLLRLSMLRSWDVPPARGTAALLLDLMVFYMARFAAPTLGLVIVLIAGSPDWGYVWTALLCGLVTALLIAILVAISRGETAAHKVGHRLGDVAHKVRRTVDPDRWADGFVSFQQESATGLAGRTTAAALTMLGFVVVDGLILVTCIRFVGIPPSELGVLTIMSAFLCVYPLTLFPFAGLGVLDASLVVLLTGVGTVESADLVAALVVWRAATLLIPLVPGLGALLWWRRSQRGLAALT